METFPPIAEEIENLCSILATQPFGGILKDEEYPVHNEFRQAVAAILDSPVGLTGLFALLREPVAPTWSFWLAETVAEERSNIPNVMDALKVQWSIGDFVKLGLVCNALKTKYREEFLRQYSDAMEQFSYVGFAATCPLFGTNDREMIAPLNQLLAKVEGGFRLAGGNEKSGKVLTKLIKETLKKIDKQEGHTTWKFWK